MKTEDIIQTASFPIIVEPPLVNNKPSEKYQAVIHGITGNEIAIRQNTVKIISNTDVLKTVLNTCSSIGIKLTPNGYHSYLRPEYMQVCMMMERTILTGPETINSCFMLTNSYDGSKSLHLEAYGIRLMCNNGMIYTKHLISEFKRNHTKNLNPDEITQWIMNYLDENKKVIHWINEMRKSRNHSKKQEPVIELLGEKFIKDINQLLANNKIQQINNEYDLYNLATNFVSTNVKPHLRVQKLSKITELFTADMV